MTKPRIKRPREFTGKDQTSVIYWSEQLGKALEKGENINCCGDDFHLTIMGDRARAILLRWWKRGKE